MDLLYKFNSIKKIDSEYVDNYQKIINNLKKDNDVDIALNKYRILDNKYIDDTKINKTKQIDGVTIFDINERLSLLLYILLISIKIYNNSLLKSYIKRKQLENISLFLSYIEEEGFTGTYLLHDDNHDVLEFLRKYMFNKLKKIHSEDEYMTITDYKGSKVFQNRFANTKNNKTSLSFLHKPLMTISNTQVKVIITEMIKNIQRIYTKQNTQTKKRERSLSKSPSVNNKKARDFTIFSTGAGHRKIYTGKKGGKYYVKIKDGRKIKVYIKKNAC